MSFLELSYDFAYFCPNCDNYSDKQPCTNCGIQLDKTNIKSLREAWEIPPNPVKDIKELVKIDSKELEEIRKKPMGSHAVKFLTDLGLNNTEIKERRVSNHLVSLLDKKIDKLFPRIHYGSMLEIPEVFTDLRKFIPRLFDNYKQEELSNNLAKLDKSLVKTTQLVFFSGFYVAVGLFISYIGVLNG